MRMSRDHILTSQAGSLPRPDDLIKANSAREAGETTDEAAFERTLQAAVVDVVRKQKEIGIDVPGDGEFGKSMGHKVNYRAWWSYCFNRLGGLDLTGPGLYEGVPKRAKPGEVVLTSFADRRDRTQVLDSLQRPRRRRLHRTGHGQMAGLHRAGRLQGPRRDQGRHRPHEGGAEGERRRRRLYDLGRAGERLAASQHLLQDRRRVHVRSRRSHARRIQGHRRCRLDPATRRPRHRRELGHDQSRAVGRGL